MNTHPLFKTAINFGAMSGIGSFAVFLALYYKGINPLGNASWVGAWIPVVFICIATKYYRDHFLAGEISYGHAMKIGLLTAMAASILFALFVYIFVTLIDSTIVTTFKNEKLFELEETKFMFGDEFYDKMVDGIEKINISTIAFNDFFIKMIGGLLVTFVTAAVYRKKNPEME
jgi:hypothetical protein